MQPELQRLANYYRDALLALAANSGRALRNLRAGRGYGLVADLSSYGKALPDFLDSQKITFRHILPELKIKSPRFASDEDVSEDRTMPDSSRVLEGISESGEGPALIRIWQKQRQDTYNRDTLLAIGVLRAESGRTRCFGPIICYRVRPEYQAESRQFSIEKLSETPFANLTLLSELLTADEMAGIRPQLHHLLAGESFGEEAFWRLAKIISGAAGALRGLHYISGGLRTYGDLSRVGSEKLPLFAAAALLLNIPRGHAYLLDDLDVLASGARDEDLVKTAVGPFLRAPNDSVGDKGDGTRRQAVELLLPLESNRSQRDAAISATTSQVLVIHGPPGTGKSQTICNLVSHLVGSGKTVLVTSQKDKALEVVRDKLPKLPDGGTLALALLRSDEESQKALLQALEYSQAAIGSATEQDLERSKRAVLERLTTNRREAAALEAKFTELRRLENECFPAFQRLRELRIRRDSMRSDSKKGPIHRLSCLARACVASFESSRIGLNARRLNNKYPDDTNSVCEQLTRLKNERKSLVINLLGVQRRLQLDATSKNRAVAFALKLAKKLLTKKKKTASLEKIKEQLNFEHLLSVFPCWILSVDDVARIFPLKPGLFDYLIVDEASQCNQASSLHLAYRAKQMIVAGDEKQLPNASVQWLPVEAVEQLLAKNGLADHIKKEFLSVHESLLSLALSSCDREVHLNEHFRCDPKIIAWSNHEFYADSLRVLTPMRSMRFRTPVEVRHVQGASEDIDAGVNVVEAEAVVDEIGRMLDDPNLAGLSMGVISPFRPQADYIHALICGRFASRWSECESRGLTSSTADGFQGDERDIILYSLRHGAGSRPGSVLAIEGKQTHGDRRLNVAFTRARRKVILFTSMPAGTFPGYFIRSFLDHASAVSAEGSGDPWGDAENDRFDSEFEREVCEGLRGAGLWVKTQYPVAGYRIDLVARDKAGRRLGIECDGPFHYDELGLLREEDYERQEILERAGWAIHRIPARRFYLDPGRELDLVVRVLGELATDQEQAALEFEDLAVSAEEAAEAEYDIAPSDISSFPREVPRRVAASQSLTPRQVDGVSADAAVVNFENPMGWMELARWARDIAHWTKANRVFVWEVGNKIRNGQVPDDVERVRGRGLWEIALKQGYRPTDTLHPKG